MIFRLYKGVVLNDGTLLARSSKGSLRLIVSFEIEEDFSEFQRNFWEAESLNLEGLVPSPGYEEADGPLARALPMYMGGELVTRMSEDPDLIMKMLMEIMERDEVAPSDNYAFQIPEEIKEILSRARARQRKS